MSSPRNVTFLPAAFFAEAAFFAAGAAFFAERRLACCSIGTGSSRPISGLYRWRAAVTPCPTLSQC
jgi:hypothetical protein